MKAIKIGDGKYAVVITDKDGILKQNDLLGISEVLKKWWESDEKFVILAEWGNLEIRFERVEESKNEFQDKQ